MAFTIKFDYRFDSSGFFDDLDRRATLEAAAAEWENIIGDEFSDIPAGASFDIRDPSDPSVTHTITLTEPIDDILIFCRCPLISGFNCCCGGAKRLRSVR